MRKPVFKIGEFSKITQVSVRMLRYYDEQGLLAPELICNENGYRYYSASQIDELNKIVMLRDMGFSVKDIKKLISDWTPELIRSKLEQQLNNIEESIQVEQRKLRQIQGYLKDVDNLKRQCDLRIVMKQLPAQYVISLRSTVEDYYHEGSMWMKMSDIMKASGFIDGMKCQSFSIYHDLDYREENVDIEICISTDKISQKVINRLTASKEGLIFRQTKCVEQAACFMIYGPYSNISTAYREFAYWLEEHPEYCMSGENRQICHVAGCDTQNPEEYVTEMQIPLAKSK